MPGKKLINFQALTLYFQKFLTAFAFMACFTLVSGITTNSALSASNPRYASFIIDADTGMILHERYADKPLHPASLTKVMTLLMVFEALEQGRLQLNDRIRISRHAASMVPSKLDLPVGSSIKVQDAIYALVTKSANDIAAAIAEHLGGSESNFARMMTRRARAIGMDRTIFRNASGLHDPRQVTTARDMATMARFVIINYPQYYRYFSKRYFTYAGQTYRNHNRLMNSYKGMDGMKTGYVAASGFNLVASAQRNNQRLIGVVFGGRSAQTRNSHMAELLDRSFAKMNDLRIAHAQVPLPPRKPGVLVAMNTLKEVTSTGRSNGQEKLAFFDQNLQNSTFGKIVGEGDYDPAATQRIQTGLMAIAAHTGEGTINNNPESVRPDLWSIQVGAFKSRAATDRALHTTQKALPRVYASAQPTIAPLKTKDGWLFRARLGGLTKAEAFRACDHLRECMPIPGQ